MQETSPKSYPEMLLNAFKNIGEFVVVLSTLPFALVEITRGWGVDSDQPTIDDTEIHYL